MIEKNGLESDTYFPDVVKICDFWRQSSVYTQELLVHKCSQGKAVEGVHTCVIHPLWILNSTCHGGETGQGKGKHAKSNNAALIHWGSVLETGTEKALRSAKKLPKHTFKKQHNFTALLWFFPSSRSESNRNTSDMCKYRKGQKILTESCTGLEGAFKWAFEVDGWTGRIINSFLEKNNSILLPLCTETHRPDSI